ncbi:carbohydrate porin [Derxia lacustris]|uniref:carbohydrate porin n=1 Tax=Derxia lacustris TaxID=764842 RepID=UPI001F3F6B64|nr:carbohydrate porin [Derxia lacustris]
MSRTFLAAAAAAMCMTAGGAQAGQWDSGDLGLGEFAANAQVTLIGQTKPRFNAAYSGPLSLKSEYERSYSMSATAFLGWKPFANTELFANPEVVQGLPLSRLAGLGGLTNGEMQKVGGTKPTLHRARLFMRQTFNLGGEQEQLEQGQNQFAHSVDRRRVVVTLGNFAANDVFDDNDIAHDPRTGFLNWSFLTYGAWDFPADARGYSVGGTVEWIHDDWTARIGRFRLPKEANGLPLAPNLAQNHGDAVEIEHRHELAGRPGALRVLGFRNTTAMGSFSDALAAAAPGTVPDLTTVRRRQDKRGFGVTAEQELADDVAAQLRASRSDGRSEVYAFAEIDASVAAALRIGGARWGRGEDSAGLGVARNSLSSAHVAYLRAGGLGYFVGDGGLDPGAERIFEAYYSLALGGGFVLTLDGQHIVDPAYNRARGPVQAIALRLHGEW